MQDLKDLSPPFILVALQHNLSAKALAGPKHSLFSSHPTFCMGHLQYCTEFTQFNISIIRASSMGSAGSRQILPFMLN